MIVIYNFNCYKYFWQMKFSYFSQVDSDLQGY